MGRWLIGMSTFSKANPPNGWHQTTVLQVVDADPPINNEAVPSIDEVKEAVAKLRGQNRQLAFVTTV